jgi:hypothetical protein
MAAQTSLFTQLHVRPVVVQWSRWLAISVMAIASSAIVIAGFLAVAQAVMHSFALVVLLLLGLFMVASAVFLPALLPQTLPKGQL